MTFLDRIKETSTSTGTGTFTLAGAVLGYKVFSNGTYKYCIVNDTESEWEVGEGTVASGVLTRTTIEASSNGGAAVSFSAGTKQVFNTVSAAYVNSLVPYTGATASVNLGEYGLTAGQLTLDTSPTGTAVVGTTRWNDTIGSSETLLKGGNVLLKNGVDLVARVVNKVTPATTLTKAAYKAVRVSGAQGQRLAVAYAQANNDNNSADTIGLVCETIAQNQEGFIITVGQLLDVNTTGSLQGETWADGDVLYLSPTTAGNLTNIKPTGATGHIVIIGYVEYAHANNGKIYVKVMNGWELTELHDTYISSVANNDVLTYESSTTLWKNKSIATILGYTPQAAITLTTTGTSGAATLIGNTLNIPQYASGISGSGTAGQVTYWTGTSAVGGSSNLTFSPNPSGLSGLGVSLNLTPILTATANNDVLTAIDLQPTFTNGAFTGVSNYAIRATGQILIRRVGSNATEGFSMQYAADNTLGGTYQSKFISLAPGVSYRDLAFLSRATLFQIDGYRNSLFISNNGNVVLNSLTDSGYRLDINGTGASTGALRVTGGSTLLVGGGATFQTNALTIQNSAGSGLLTLSNGGELFLFGANNTLIMPTDTNPSSPILTGRNTLFYNYNASSSASIGSYIFSGSNFTQQTGNNIVFNILKGIAPSGGTGTFALLALSSTINQTGGANGITRGLYVNPTLTAAADFRAIETTNGKIVFGNLPTSSAGLPTGALWNNLGVINIV